MESMRQTWTDARMDDLATSVDARFEQVDKRFEQVDKRFEQVDKRFEQIHGDIKGLRDETNRNFATLNRRFDLLVGVLLAASLSGVVAAIVS
jgi:DNA anti-recombination protein RmuC